MKALAISLLLITAPALALAQTATKPAAKPAAKAAASKPAARPAAAKPAATPKLAPAAQKAVEEATPLEEADPTIKLTEGDLEVARRVYVGEIPCELGASVKITPLKREGFFLVQTGRNRFRMHPVESRTGAIRLEDPVRGAMWLQLGNKSMLMSQKLGQRLADECQSPDQVTFTEAMKSRPAVNILEATPAARPASAPIQPAESLVPGTTSPPGNTPVVPTPAGTTPVAPAPAATPGTATAPMPAASRAQ
ncbi:hypothetical protein [Caenimonas sedimenti]|uniref:hypothetical protein n=1 Tax=Caenimonas sedimenti TaxID=2596921 RepID=UPI0032C477BB